jgi:tol-pal system protein YbgF
MSPLLRKLSFLVVLLVGLAVVSGCATSKDLRKVRSELLDRVEAAEKKLAALDQAEQTLKGEVKTTGDAVTHLQRRQAETDADLADAKDQVRQIRGLVDGLKKDLSAGIGSQGELKDKVDALSFKVQFLENYLGVGKHNSGGETGTRTGANGKEATKGKSEQETLYGAAYATLKEGKYEKARAEFQNFLKKYPSTELSDDAQFWIGESYFFEGKLEKAILEYEKVIKNYPEGSKVPQALLKQGLSFAQLGDKSSARIILQQIIKDYPNTSSARTARSKLNELK